MPAYGDGFSLSWGQGSSRYMFKGDKEITPDAFRLAYVESTDYQWRFGDNQIIKLELEFGLHHWKDPLLEKAKNGLMLNPMWRYFYSFGDHAVYAGIGIGLAYTDDRFWMDRKLGSRWLFEDRLEVGALIFTKHRMSFSLNHYSNANIADINHGANVFYLNYAISL
jgi:hypothetical protein